MRTSTTAIQQQETNFVSCNIIKIMNNLSNSFEPMDIDLSVHSNNAMDISSTSDEIDLKLEHDRPYLQPEAPAAVLPVETIPLALRSHSTQQSSNLKKFHININMHKEANSIITTKSKIMCTIIILLLSVLTYQVLNIQCGNDINPDELKRSLYAKLYGQPRAIDSLIEALSVDERTKILFFYGGTGVGKTFAASLILEHIGYYSNVYHYTMPSFMDTFTTDFMIGLTVCKYTIFIIDDLSAKDMNVKSHIKDVITKSENLDKNITIILIYNCDNADKGLEGKCDASFPDNLIQNFNYIDAFKKLIKFETLEEEHIKKCIETELGNRKLTNNELEKIVKNFNASLDGCKGVYTKMKLLEIS